MICFEKVRWQNLLSTGNEFTELTLNDKKTTLIVGKNGSGKSTLLEALSFCLYKKAFRNINLPQLINSINDKHLLVEVELTTNGKMYRIRRGLKPAIFEIYENGVLLNQSADSKDYQTYLEKNILRMNFRSFKQIVILGSADFVPFMQLPAQARREVIEDLLDLQIFSVMNTLLKEKINENKSSIIDIEHSIALSEKMLKMHLEHVEELKKNNEELAKEKTEAIHKLIQENDIILLEIEGLRSMLVDLEKEKLELEKSQIKSKEYESMIDKLLKMIEKIETSIQFYSKNDNCPTCKQTITEEFRADIIKEREGKANEYHDAISTLHKKLKKYENIITRLNITSESIAKFNNAITAANIKITTNNKLIEAFQKEIEELNKKTDSIKNKKETDAALKKELVEKRKRKVELNTDREILSISASLLKDGGIKSLIIKQHIPIINSYINKYLKMMEFYVDFYLDENFREIIRSRYRDEFTYDSFSQGEKMRLNLALLFAWRSIAKMRNSSTTNLLIFDEIFDSSLDDKGIEEFIKILQSLTKDNNTFIISHKVDAMIDKFDHVIRFSKIKNFSKIDEISKG